MHFFFPHSKNLRTQFFWYRLFKIVAVFKFPQSDKRVSINLKKNIVLAISLPTHFFCFVFNNLFSLSASCLAKISCFFFFMEHLTLTDVSSVEFKKEKKHDSSSGLHKMPNLLLLSETHYPHDFGLMERKLNGTIF